MLAEVAAHAADIQSYPWAGGPGGWHEGGAGWWLVFPIVFWALVLTGVGYLIYRGSSRQSARRAAERTLAERFAAGEISEQELRQRRATLRGRP